MNRAKHICGHPGCSALCDERYCDKHVEQHSSQAYDRNRNQNDPYRRLYKTAQWERIREYIKGRDILCKIGHFCEGKAPVEVVDHVIPARVWCAGGGSFWDTNNLQGACKVDHDWKTGTEEAGGWAKTE